MHVPGLLALMHGANDTGTAPARAHMHLTDHWRGCTDDDICLCTGARRRAHETEARQHRHPERICAARGVLSLDLQTLSVVCSMVKNHVVKTLQCACIDWRRVHCWPHRGSTQLQTRGALLSALPSAGRFTHLPPSTPSCGTTVRMTAKQPLWPKLPNELPT